MDYYKILGVSKTANLTDIKKAYKKLSMKYHPDRPNGDETKFKEISAAYDILSNENKRHEFDFGSHTNFQPFSDNMAQHIFKNFFGNNDPFQNLVHGFNLQPEGNHGGFFSVQTTTIRHPDGRVDTTTTKSSSQRPRTGRRLHNF